MLIYTNALGKLQGYTPPKAYILGRKWNYVSGGMYFSGNGWFDRLGVIDFEKVDKMYHQKTDQAVEYFDPL